MANYFGGQTVVPRGKKNHLPYLAPKKAEIPKWTPIQRQTVLGARQTFFGGRLQTFSGAKTGAFLAKKVAPKTGTDRQTNRIALLYIDVSP